MKATLHSPGQAAQTVTLTENTCQAASLLLGIAEQKVEVMFHSPGPVHGCTIYVDKTMSRNASWDKYTAKHPYLIVQL